MTALPTTTACWIFLALVPLGGCSGTASRDAPGAPGTSDSGCGAQFLALEYEQAGATASNLCFPLPNGVTMNAIGCMATDTNVTVGAHVQLSLSGSTGLFRTPGDVMVNVTLLGRGLECGSHDGFCYFSSPPSGCRATVIQAGGIGQWVELSIADACALRHHDAAGIPGATLVVNRLRMRGTMRLFAETTDLPDGSVPFADCGIR